MTALRTLLAATALLLTVVATASAQALQQYDLIDWWGPFGSGNGEISSPRGVATDAAGNVYVSETGNQRIQKFTSRGRFITKWGSPGSGDGQFSRQEGIAVDPAGNVY